MAPIFMTDIGLLFSCDVSVWLWCQGNAPSWNGRHASSESKIDLLILEQNELAPLYLRVCSRFSLLTSEAGLPRTPGRALQSGACFAERALLLKPRRSLLFAWLSNQNYAVCPLVSPCGDRAAPFYPRETLVAQSDLVPGLQPAVF